MTNHDEQRELLTLAEELGFDISDDAVNAVLDTADKLAESVPEKPTAEERKSVGTMADDSNNALLEVYDEPRVEREEGSLSGFDIAVKDIVAVKDLTMTCGSKSFAVVPSYDATVVERLLDAGVALVGKANTDAFAFGPTGEFSEFGRVVNPIDPDRVPGGSSSGSAVAVSAGTVDASLGTDTGGSVRIPASCCGVVGIKPTHGSVPRYGFVDLAPTTDTIGPIARDVETLTRVLDTIRGADVRDSSSNHAASEPTPLSADLLDDTSLSFGLLEPFFERSSAVVSETVRNAAAALNDSADVSVESVGIDLGNIERAYPLTIATEFAWQLRQRGIIRGQGTQYTEEWRRTTATFVESLNEHIALRVLPAAYLDASTNGRSYVAARKEAIAFRQRLCELFDKYDLLLAPTLRVVPPKYGEVTATKGMNDISGNTGPFSLTGNPVLTVPAGTANGLSIGMQLIAPHFKDHRVLRGGALVEQIR